MDLQHQVEQFLYRQADLLDRKKWQDWIDLFTPDGIASFAQAWERRVEVEGFPVCHLDDIIASKKAANRAKDRESLPRLESFREYWMRQQRASRKL